MNQKTPQTPPVLVLVKAMRLLRCFTAQEPTHTLSSLSQKLDMPKSSVHRLLCTLQADDFISCDSAGNYSLGIALLESAAVVLRTLDFRNIAKPHLQALAKELGETIYLSTLSGSDIIYLDEIQGFQYMTMGTRLGTTAPAFCSAMGKLLLSQLTHEQFEQLVLSRPLIPKTAKTIVDPQALWESLSLVSSQGYAFDDEEFETGICCLAAPIYNHLGDVIAAFGLSSPTVRLNRETLLQYLPSVLNVSVEISRDLGYRG